MRTMCVPSKTLCPTLKDCKWRYLVFHRKRLELMVLPWQQYSRCHFVSFVMYISDAKFEDINSQCLMVKVTCDCFMQKKTFKENVKI